MSNFSRVVFSVFNIIIIYVFFFILITGKKKAEVLNPVQENQDLPGSPPRTSYSGTLFSPVYHYIGKLYKN